MSTRFLAAPFTPLVAMFRLVAVVARRGDLVRKLLKSGLESEGIKRVRLIRDLESDSSAHALRLSS